MDLKYFGVMNKMKDEREVDRFDDYCESYFMVIVDISSVILL